MRLHFTERFFDDYESLPERLQNRTDRALGFLLENFRHPSLRAHKLEGQRDPEGRDIWAASVTDAYRFTFAIDKDAEMYILYRVGLHDIERRPS
ncbi:MAG: cytotoxin [Candidatus Tectomicrobia bacterium]|nr:cytotoxin [Candidatus Tectomicrobia bacterium]